MAENVVINETSKDIWNFLMKRIGNPYGVAAIMGNLMAECSMNPKCVTGLYKTIYQTGEQYITDSNTGNHDFANDGLAFGLVQWAYKSRKKALLDFARSQGASVGALYVQLDYMWDEIQKYPSVMDAVKNAKDVRSASDVVMEKYERPANQSEAVKIKRATYGQKYLAHYYGEKPKHMKMVLATDNVRIRSGDSKKYGQVGTLKKDNQLEWVATSNGFHAVRMQDRIGWVSGEFSKVVDV